MTERHSGASEFAGRINTYIRCALLANFRNASHICVFENFLTLPSLPHPPLYLASEEDEKLCVSTPDVQLGQTENDNNAFPPQWC